MTNTLCRNCYMWSSLQKHLQKQLSITTKLGLSCISILSTCSMSLLVCHLMVMIKWQWMHMYKCHAHIQLHIHTRTQRKAIQAESKWMTAKVRQCEVFSYNGAHSLPLLVNCYCYYTAEVTSHSLHTFTPLVLSKIQKIQTTACHTISVIVLNMFA